MVDTTRRVLAVLLFAVALVGVIPWLPQVLGYTSAIVNNYSAGTYVPTTAGDTPQAPFISCEQFPATNEFDKNSSSSGKYFRCSNNWGSAVTLTWSKVSGDAGVTVTGSDTIPAGSQNRCMNVDLTFSASAKNGDVVYLGTINQADLSGTIQFAGTLRFPGKNPKTQACTP